MLEILWRLMLLVRLMLRPDLLWLLLAAIRLRLLSRCIGWLLIGEVLLIAGGLLIAEILLTLHGLGGVVVVAVEGIVTIAFAWRRRRLVIGVLLPELFLRGGDQAGIVFGMLEVIFGGDWVAGRLGVAGKLKIFFSNVVSGSPDLHLRAVRLVNPRQWIVMVMPATATTVMALIAAITSTHALVLSVSHGSLVADSCFWRLFPANSLT